MAIIRMQGIGQMTAAQQTLLRQASGVGTARASARKGGNGSKSAGRRSTTGSKKRASGSAKRNGKKKGSKFVKGSAAAKSYMAKIRKMRKRK